MRAKRPPGGTKDRVWGRPARAGGAEHGGPYGDAQRGGSYSLADSLAAS
jgi:hypothetical protein